MNKKRKYNEKNKHKKYENYKKEQNIKDLKSDSPHRYRIKNKQYGVIYVSVKDHCQKRMEERNIDILKLLYVLTKNSEKITTFSDHKHILLIDKLYNISILLAVSRNSKNYCYFNIITVLSGIPKKDDGELKFHHVHHFLAV